MSLTTKLNVYNNVATHFFSVSVTVYMNVCILYTSHFPIYWGAQPHGCPHQNDSSSLVYEATGYVCSYAQEVTVVTSGMFDVKMCLGTTVHKSNKIKTSTQMSSFLFGETSDIGGSDGDMQSKLSN